MGLKVCTTCRRKRDLQEFAVKRKIPELRSTKCRKCQRKYAQEHYRKNKEAYKKRAIGHNAKQTQVLRKFLWEYLLEHECVDCGESDPVVLEFDHVRGKKKYNVAELTNGKAYAISTVKAEIAKCEVRCANCHVRRTAKGQGSWRFQFAKNS